MVTFSLTLVQVNVGFGGPSASHVRLTFSPSFMVVSFGGVVIRGGTKILKQNAFS